MAQAVRRDNLKRWGGILGGFLWACFLFRAVYAQETLPAPTPVKNALLGTVPAGATVALTADKTNYLWGERITLTFRLENTGATPFTFSFGGDYRGTPRHLRFRVTAKDAEGNTVPDPTPFSSSLGGIITTPELAPGGIQEWEIPLLRYCRLDKPGTYTIRATHDFGWEANTERPLPEAEFTLTLVEPTPEQARTLVTQFASNPLVGGEGGRKPDYSSLTAPIYLTLLSDRAREKNDAQAAVAIGNIPTPEATLVLLDLSASVQPTVASAACTALNARLPLVERDRIGTNGEYDPQREYLVKRSWRESIALPIRVRAAVLLTSSRPELVRAGAEMLERTGTWEDLGQLIRALNREMQKFEDTYPQPPSVRSDLLRTVDQLYRRSAVPPKSPASKAPGECAAYLRWISYKGWESLTATEQAKVVPLLKHPVATVRALALDTLPERFPSSRLKAEQRRLAESKDGVLKAARKVLPSLLEDKSRLVRVYACAAAGKVQDWNLRPQLQKILTTSDSRWERAAAGKSLLELGGRYLYLTTWAGMLDRKGMMYEALYALSSVRSHGGSTYNQKGESPTLGKQLKTKWLTFLQTHRAAIEGGKVWEWDDTTFPADLIPAHFQLEPPPLPSDVPGNDSKDGKDT